MTWDFEDTDVNPCLSSLSFLEVITIVDSTTRSSSYMAVCYLANPCVGRSTPGPLWMLFALTIRKVWILSIPAVMWDFRVFLLLLIVLSKSHDGFSTYYYRWKLRTCTGSKARKWRLRAFLHRDPEGWSYLWLHVLMWWFS